MTRIKNERLSKIVADRLLEQIIGEQYHPGDRLPTEPELMKEFGVSRTVIREAAALLVSRGIVDVRPRRGMTVRSPDGSGIAESLTAQLRMSDISPSQLLQVRLILETAIVRIAATERTAEDLNRLTFNLKRITDPSISVDETIRLDIDFHDLLAHATHNPFFPLVYRPIHVLLGSFYSQRDTYATVVDRTFTDHKAIFRAVSDGNAVEAVTAMRKHLNRVEKHVTMMIQPIHR